MVYFLLADGFEETEAIAPFDMVKRAGENAVFVSVSENLTVTGAHGIKVVADMYLEDVSAEKGKMIVLPGGKLGVENLDKTEGFDEIIKAFADSEKFVCAICAAPSLLGKRGYLKGLNAVCYPEEEFQKHLADAHIQNTRVVRDGKFITAVGAGASLEFGFELVTALTNRETADKIKAGIK